MAGLKLALFIATVAITIITVSGRAVNISNTWVLPEEGFPVFYRYFRDRISWNEADAVCQFHHANLVTVDTTSEYDAVRAYLKELDITTNVWIGLSRTGDKRNFTWRDFRALSLTDYWQEAIPTGNDPLCAAMDPAADFRWHALSCGGPSVAAFICELPVPSWASGPDGCLPTELPSLTVLYIPEQSAVELTSDCGLGGTKRIACKGSTDRAELMRRLACTVSADILEDKTQSPVPTTINQDSTYTSANTAHTTNTKTTKPWIWTSNTIDTGDYGLPTRHRRETEDTMSPSSTRSTTDFSTKMREITTVTESLGNDPLTTESVIMTTPSSEGSSLVTEVAPEFTTHETKSVPNEEYPSAINQGQLFSIIENGTMFDIIELNGTEDNKTSTVPPPPPTDDTHPLYTTVIYHKEPTEDTVSTRYKIQPTSTDTKTTKKASINDLPSRQYDKTLSKEVEMYSIATNSLVKLNRTNRKELPNSSGIMKPDLNIIIDIDNNIQEKPNKDELIHKTVEIRIHKPGFENTTKSTLFVTTKHSTVKSTDKKIDFKKVSPQTFETDKFSSNEAKSKYKEEYKNAQAYTTEYTSKAQSDGGEEFTTLGTTDTKTPAEESLGAEPTTKPNRQRQLTRPQRRSFYPYFFSRVLG